MDFLDFKALLIAVVNEEMEERDANNVLGKIEWDAWIFLPGVSPVLVDFYTPVVPQVKDLAKKFIELRGSSSPDDSGFFESLSLDGKCVFLQYLYDHLAELSEEILAKIDGEYSLTTSKNMEILWRWFRITIPVGYPTASSYIHTFVGSIGRLKMIQPIYSALVANGEQELALAYFNEFKSFYHPIAASAIQQIISGGEEEEEKEEFMKRTTIQR